MSLSDSAKPVTGVQSPAPSPGSKPVTCTPHSVTATCCCSACLETVGSPGATPSHRQLCTLTQPEDLPGSRSCNDSSARSIQSGGPARDRAVPAACGPWFRKGRPVTAPASSLRAVRLLEVQILKHPVSVPPQVWDQHHPLSPPHPAGASSS